MAIGRLSSTAALIAALRDEVVRKAALPQRPAQTSTISRAETGRRPTAPSVAQLRRQLVDIVKDVDLGDAEAVRHTRTRFVRAVLLWEFGQEFREHPEWRPLMDRIQQALDSDAAQNDRYMHLLTSLKSRQHK
jgi:hypothetical protein